MNHSRKITSKNHCISGSYNLRKGKKRLINAIIRNSVVFCAVTFLQRPFPKEYFQHRKAAIKLNRLAGFELQNGSSESTINPKTGGGY